MEWLSFYVSGFSNFFKKKLINFQTLWNLCSIVWIFIQWNYLIFEIGILDSLLRKWNGSEFIKIANPRKILLKSEIFYNLIAFVLFRV